MEALTGVAAAPADGDWNEFLFFLERDPRVLELWRKRRCLFILRCDAATGRAGSAYTSLAGVA